MRKINWLLAAIFILASLTTQQQQRLTLDDIIQP